MKTKLLRVTFIAVSALSFVGILHADVSVPTLFSDHMVLQRDKPIQIWGWASPGESVKASFNGKSAKARTGKDGKWQLDLPAMQAGGPYELTISGKNTLNFSDVMVGEVWLASGQSNMAWVMNSSFNADLKKLMAASQRKIRFNNVKNMGSQEPQDTTDNVWIEITPETIGNVSAVAYSFAETLHDTLNVPIGII